MSGERPRLVQAGPFSIYKKPALIKLMTTYKYVTILSLIVSNRLSLVCSPASAVCNPEPVIVNELPRMGKGWSGSVAWYNSKIYEVADATSYALVKDPVTGVHEDTIAFGSWADNDTKGFTYDPFRGTFWCKVGQYAYQVAVTGGDYISRLNVQRDGFTFGIWCDPDEENVMWVADPVDAQVRKLNMLDGSVLQYVNTDFNVRGVSRVGDTLWCVRAGEPGQTGVVIQVDMEGNELCKYTLPEAKYDHDAGGCDIDPDGYLWVHGGKDTAIYQFDIGYVPTTPTPSALPTPVSLVIDSGDYDGDSTSDIAVYRGASGLWAIRDVTRVYYGRNGDTPVSGDYNGDGTTDLGLYRNSIGLWVVRGITRSYFGDSEDIPVPGDYDGDGDCDLSIFRPSSGLWAVKSVTRAYFGSPADIPVPLYYGNRSAKYMAIYRPASGLWSIRGLGRGYFGGPSDQPIPANYDGAAGGTDLGIFRDSNGLWAIRGVTRVYFGRAGDQAVPGSYRGGDIAEMGIFRSSSGLWVIRGVTRAYFGGANDIPVSGRVPDFLSDRPLVDSSDYNGDGTDDIAVFRPSTGLWAIRGVSRLYFGQSDDIPAPGDYSGAGTTMVSVYRSNGHLWNVRNLTQVNFGSRLIQQPVPADYTGDGISDMGFYYDGLWTIRIQFPIPYVFEVQFGQAGDQPVPGNYGGGKSELLAVFRPSTGLWAVKSLTSIYFGIDGDIGMPADYNGDGVSDPAVYRPDQGKWIVRNITAVNFKDYDGTLPLVGDFDGNGTYGMGLFRPADGLWQINDLTRFYFGGCADIPVSGSPDAYSF